MTLHAYATMPFDKLTAQMTKDLLAAKPFDRGEWQSQSIADKPQMVTKEVLNVSFEYLMPNVRTTLVREVKPNLPWAEDHFLERVGRVPLNPPPSEAWWPFAQQGNRDHKPDERFSHTYPERMWPKYAGSGPDVYDGVNDPILRGIRFDYGDLGDVINQLKKSPRTRQAYLPIWFPEDTGAVHGERVPCTLGYHFLIDHEDRLQITYYIRSCDFVRHFRDDVYMAVRLAQWVGSQVGIDNMGNLIMHIANLHCFVGDTAKLEYESKQAEREQAARLLSGF